MVISLALPAAAIVRLGWAAVNGQTVPQGKAQWRQAELLGG